MIRKFENIKATTKRKWIKKTSRWGVDDKRYHNKKWRNLREKVLRTNPLCVNCERRDIIKQADVVDHVKPITAGGEFYNENNLQGLCHACHNRKSAQQHKKEIKENSFKKEGKHLKELQ